MQLYYKLNKSIDFVFSHLTDMEKFSSVHPIITKIDKISDDSYMVHESIPMGFLPFSFTYPVQIQEDGATKCVTMKAKVFGIAEIEMTFRLFETLGQTSKDESTTKVEETIVFKGVLSLVPFLKPFFKTQHRQLFKNIEKASLP